MPAEPKKKKPKKTHRLNLEVKESVEREMAETQMLDDSPSRTEMLRRAVRVFRTIRQVQLTGGKVILQHADGKNETLIIL